MISLFGCANSKAKQQENFLKHIYKSAPEPYKDCMVNYIKDHWDHAWETYDSQKLRDARGETDIANFMIEKFLPECKK